MKKPHRKPTVHPTPPLSDKLAFLPAAILAISASLSKDEQEALAYLLSCPSGNFNKKSPDAACGGGADHPPFFGCYCFNCYMSYWARWDSSPNRHLIHQAIDAYEDGLQRKNEKNRGGKKKGGNRDSCGSFSNNESGEDPGAANPAEESAGGGGAGDGCGEERGAVRSFVSFLGEKIRNVWN
ncbi:unnamed protein product [Cuscuta campestris]|uniref:Uncharacterized protein n=1 Tax=Cuscuta campestris TaxID=132261 RepID=A0A484N6X9_9ASTE|nr:unnamed protein product [Cuscuta campestris]